MGFLSNIGGMLPAAYTGFQKGVDDVTARQQREADAAYQQEQRDRERQMAPLEDEIRKKRLAAAGIKIDNEMELAPGQQERARQELAHLSKIDPLRRSTEEWNAIRESSDNKQRFIESAVPKLGEAIHTNNIAGVNVGVRNLFDAGLFKDVDGLQGVTAARSEIVVAPDGATDFRGQPVKGRAIKVTLSDGRDGFIGTDYMLAQYAKQMQSADAAGAKILPAGSTLVSGSGRPMAYGQPRYPGGGDGAGSRSGGGSRAPADASKQAQDALEFLTKSEEFKTLTTSQVASAQLFTGRAAAAGVSPNEAAFIGMEVAKDPAKIKTYVDESGDVQSAYSDPNINGGRPTVLATGASSLAEVAKTPEGLKSVADAVTGILDSQVMGIEKAKTPEERQAVRDQFIKAAHSPTERAALLKAIEGAGPKAVAAMDKRLELIRLYGPKPKSDDSGKKPNQVNNETASGSKPARPWLESLGMTPSPGYTPQASYDRERPNLTSVFGVGRPVRPAQEQQSEPQGAKSPQSLGDDFQSPEARAALARRVHDAAIGGKPLSDVERLRAQQLRIL